MNARSLPVPRPASQTPVRPGPEATPPHRADRDAFDRAARAFEARATHGVSGAALAATIADWATQLARAPGKQFDLAEREVIYLINSELNACHYCLSAHSFIAEKLANTAPDALLKVGYCHYELKEWAQAVEHLTAVLLNPPADCDSQSILQEAVGAASHLPEGLCRLAAACPAVRTDPTVPAAAVDSGCSSSTSSVGASARVL
jgi:AhpD family alkylhydroperoxidase